MFLYRFILYIYISITILLDLMEIQQSHLSQETRVVSQKSSRSSLTIWVQRGQYFRYMDDPKLAFRNGIDSSPYPPAAESPTVL